MSATETSVEMPGVLDNILEVIGRTPMVRLHRSVKGLAPELLCKVEYFNPGGSTKDRIAFHMIREAEENGELHPGGTIVEATAGNTGVGLALVAAVRGYRCIFVMPDKMSSDKVKLLKAYGAEVVITPTNVPPDSPESYNGVADRLAREIQGAWRPGQFNNMANPKAHYETTGPEIWEQTGGRVTAVVAGAGTGGTISGVGRFLKEKNPKIKLIGADPEGSILSGDTPKPWKVEGIGEDFVPQTLNAHMIDEWIRISDQESFTTARRIAREEGLMLGGSCGTALAAAFKYAARLTPDDVVVVICPDTGRNYMSKMYDDSWMAENGFFELPPERTTAGTLLVALGRGGRLFQINPEQTIAEAGELMRHYGISQLPVIENGHMVGAVEELTLMHVLHSGMSPEEVKIRSAMARPLPSIACTTLLEEAYRMLLAGYPAIVVTRGGRPDGIITRSDLMSYYEKTAVKRPQEPPKGPTMVDTGKAPE